MRLLLIALLISQHVHDESVPITPKLYSVNRMISDYSVEWLQEAPNVNDIYWYIYKYYLDTAEHGTRLNNPTCTGASYGTFRCTASLGSLTTHPGKHSFSITVSRFVSGDSIQYPSQTSNESRRSNVVEFTVKQPPPQMYPNTPYGKAPVIVR